MAQHLNMRKGFAGAAALLFLAAGTYLGQPGARGLQPSAVITPDGKEARSTVLIVTGADGWTKELANRAKRLSDMHTLVVGVGGRALLAQAGGGCAAAAPLLSGLARRTQQQQDALARSPVLSGYGEGAAIALQAAAAPNSFKGLVTVQFDASPVPCAGNALEDAQAGKAPVRWLDIAQPALAWTSCLLPFTSRRLRQPEIPTPSFCPGMAVGPILTSSLSDWLAARGIPVAGISSLRYMWQEKRPEQIAADLVRIDSHFRRAFRQDKILLLGFSLGASTLPFAAAVLPEDFLARLAGVGLIAPETHTGFEIVVGGWLGRQTGSVEVAPAIDVLAASLPPERVLCLYGLKETVSACPLVRQPGAQRLGFNGGHPLGKDYSRIADALATLASSGP